jgi:hypothetical protein
VVVLLLLRFYPQPLHAHHASLHAALRLGVAVLLGMAVYLPIAGVGWLRRSAQAPAGNATAPGSAEPNGSGDNLTI